MGLGTSKTGNKAVTFGEMVLIHSDDGPREEGVASGRLATEAHRPAVVSCEAGSESRR